jgi:Flp pilus assembly pilin Flp
MARLHFQDSDPHEQPLRKRNIMTLLNIFKSFANDEAGAVTVDWVVLTAAIVGLGIIVMTSVGGGVTTLGDAISTKVGGQTVGYVSP